MIQFSKFHGHFGHKKDYILDLESTSQNFKLLEDLQSYNLIARVKTLKVKDFGTLHNTYSWVCLTYTK